VPAQESELVPLPEDRELLAAMVRTLLAERNHEKQHAEEQKQRAQAQAQRAEELQVELLRLQLELERFKKWYYGPRADRLQSTEQLSQLLLNFAEQLEQKPFIRAMFGPRPSSSSSDASSGAKGGAILPTSKIFPSPRASTS
jgi:hypothetical protein